MTRKSCPFPKKVKYFTLTRAFSSLRRHQQRRGFETLGPYKCLSHWHLGNNGVPYPAPPPSQRPRLLSVDKRMKHIDSLRSTKLGQT